MATVRLSQEAQENLEYLPIKIHARVIGVIGRLEKWPHVSGAKALKHGLSGQYRIRTGDYRVQFMVKGDVVTIIRIGNRDGFYED
jgi:mRNA-degrading endonuclease RelE of RelBE toxin-antitoxin system